MEKDKPGADAVDNKITVLFPMELAKKLYIEFDEKWTREHANEVLFPELTDRISGNTVTELWLKPDDEELEFVSNELCLMAISQWKSILHIVNSTINGPVVLNNMLVPVEENINMFHKEMAELFANWDEALDTSYRHVFGNNSEQGKQLINAFAANLRAEIDKTDKLLVTENLVITKSGSRYILERKLVK